MRERQLLLRVACAGTLMIVLMLAGGLLGVPKPVAWKIALVCVVGLAWSA